MAAKPMDATASFEHVAENVPQWRTSISELAVYAAKRYEEYVAEYSKLLHQGRTRKKKSGSVASIHSKDETEAQAAPEPQAVDSPTLSDLAGISPYEAGDRIACAQANRKRKAGTSLQSNASGALKSRSKQMAVVYYDSHIQSELDRLVKGFAAARNNLRKGKNAYTAAKGFSLPSLSRRYETFNNLVPNTMLRSNPLLSKAQSAITSTATTNPATIDAAFPQTDKELEAIRSLCETAAHQVLRYGDCTTELHEALEKMDTLLSLAESALDLLKVEQQKEDEKEAHAADNASVSDHASAQSTLYEKSSTEAVNTHSKSLLHAAELPTTRKSLPTTIPYLASAPLTTDIIEVDDDDDDDDDSSIDINLNFASYRTAGRSGLAA
ncbi:hypothetical protein H2198_007158 [Neophaeococcomyces mojaviensis]|uniref:Uncharacterized protein n=1 Tax=Neophaeococcomyces mojaviensis TaxID=3383035 RepID=A0ACC3A0V9_9EURO|nr:hypothetical protein H2198_007158 [Knufia sp. JES_112]